MKEFNPDTIISRRKSLNLNRPALARKSKIAQSFLYNIEKNEKTPSAKTLAKLADALEVNIDFFFTDTSL
jgi:transcriptional regulator with XRE-family HTH domain